MNKFIGEVISYLLFLIFLIVATLNGTDKSGQRVPATRPVDWCIWIWIASYVWDHGKILWFSGIKGLFSNKMMAYDVAMNLCFATSAVSRLASAIMSHSYGSEYKHEPRKFWPWDDPALVSEAFFSIATMLAFARILRLFLVRADEIAVKFVYLFMLM